MPPRRIAVVLASSIALAACKGGETPTSPTTTTPTTTTTVAEPTTTEEFTGVLPVGGSSFYSFSVEQNGTVRVTFTNVGGTNVPSSVWLGLGLGTPGGEDCATTTSLNTQAGSSAQISGTYVPGVYCVRIADIGNLAAPARFTLMIDHP